MFLSLLLLAQSAPATTARYDCDNPSPDDGRPYTLCLAETDFDHQQAMLNRQFSITLKRIRARLGITAERRLRTQQRKWTRERDRRCEAEAAATPVTQNGRNQMACRSQLTAERTRFLKRVAQDR